MTTHGPKQTARLSVKLAKHPEGVSFSSLGKLMAGYFGTEIQQRLQAQAEGSDGFISVTPGACQAGRTMAWDDPQQFGWDRISEIIDRDGFFGFRLIGTANVDAVRSELNARGLRFDTWEVFLADRETALAASLALAAGPLPSGYSQWPTPTEPESQQYATYNR